MTLIVYISLLTGWEEYKFEFDSVAHCKAVEYSLEVNAWKLRKPEVIFREGGGRGLYFIGCDWNGST